MIVFITSIKHPENSRSYEKVWALLIRTLTSVCNQLDREFKVIVVCNKTLPLEDKCKKHNNHIEFIEVNFPPVSQTGYDGIRIDRGSKYTIGLIAAKKYKPEYIMFFDADDYVGNDISQYANNHKSKSGWVIDKGYIMNGNKFMPIVENFYKFCGTSNILNYDIITSEINPDLTEKSNQDEILEKIDEYYLLFIIGSHKFAEPYFKEKGIPLGMFPNYAAVYVTSTGENHSDFIGFSQNIENSVKNLQDHWSYISADQMNYFNISLNN